jgi:hypothetical protein
MHHVFTFSSFGVHKLKESLSTGRKVQTRRENQRTPRLQEMMHILGLTFHVTAELVQVTIRPLPHQPESNSLRTSW